MPHSRIFFPETLQAGQTVGLNDQAVKHIQVLRLQPSQTVELFNGNGLAYLARIERMGKHTVDVLVTEQLPAQAPAACRTHLVVSMPANERMDWMIEKATELGVCRITPVISERSVLRLSGERALKRHGHWSGIAQAACAQSGRNQLPQLDMPLALNDFFRTLTAFPAQLHVVLSLNPSAQTWRTLWQHPPASLLFLCGPEGGLSPQEEHMAVEHGFVAAHLGHATLRSETAALAVLAQLL